MVSPLEVPGVVRAIDSKQRYLGASLFQSWGLDEIHWLSALVLFLQETTEERNKCWWLFSQYFYPCHSKPRRNRETDGLKFTFHMKSLAFWAQHGSWPVALSRRQQQLKARARNSILRLYTETPCEVLSHQVMLKTENKKEDFINPIFFFHSQIQSSWSES